MISTKTLLRKVRQNALISAMIVGAVGYEIFARTECLFPIGDAVSPWLPEWLPVGLFLLLYFTFCKIKISELRPRTWHFVIQVVRTCLAAFMVFMIMLFGSNPDVKLVLEGMFICFICPTAAAVVVIAEKLGGSIGSLTVFMVIANMVTMIIIPLFFPMVERDTNITFVMTMMMLLRNVFIVLVVPLALALLSRKYIPDMVARINKHKNIGFYIWCVNLVIVTGLTLKNIAHSTVSGWVLGGLLFTPLFVCLIQFAIGKVIGIHYNDSVCAAQALGQKNTVVGIWLTLSFLNPLAAVAPGAYVLWQNLLNGWQLWYKDKYGKVKW